MRFRSREGHEPKEAGRRDFGTVLCGYPLGPAYLKRRSDGGVRDEGTRFRAVAREDADEGRGTVTRPPLGGNRQKDALNRRTKGLFSLLVILALLPPLVGCGGGRTKEAGGSSGWTIERIGTGSFPRWSWARDLITYTDLVDGQYEVFVCRPDGSEALCLTADKEALRGCGHRGQSAWHPSGEYIVFTAENAAYPRLGHGASARPGWGRNHDVWIMNADASGFWRITDYPENWAVMEPSFSHDGSKIFWCEEYSMEKYPNGKEGDLLLPGDRPTGPPYGHPGAYHSALQFTYRVGEEMLAWRIVSADIAFGPDGPVLSNIRKLEPPAGYTLNEANGFLPGDDGFIGCYSILAETNGRAVAGELLATDLGGRPERRLTDTAWLHDEDPCFSPDGSLIAFKETGGIVGHEDEIYLMRADGTGKTRLTHFTEPGYPEYDPVYEMEDAERYAYRPSGTQITEMCFSPDGRRLVFGRCRPTGDPLESALEIHSYLYVLTLPETCLSGVE